jgi:hypothetical protein
VGSLDRDSKHLGSVFVSVWSLETLSYFGKETVDYGVNSAKNVINLF